MTPKSFDYDVFAGVVEAAREAKAQALRAQRRSRILVAIRRLSREPLMMMTRCAWCDRVKLADAWFDRAEIPWLPVDIGERTTHGICPPCFDSYLAEDGRFPAFDSGAAKTACDLRR